MLPRGFRRGQVNFRSHNSCLSLGASSPGRRRACVLFGVSFRGGYSPTGPPSDTAWLAFPPTGWGWLGVLSHLVEQQERKATQPSSGWWRCANPPRGEPSWSPSLVAQRCGRSPATPGSAESGRVDGRWGGAWRPPWCRRAGCRRGWVFPPRRRIVGGRLPHQCRYHGCGCPRAADFVPARAPGP